MVSSLLDPLLLLSNIFSTPSAVKMENQSYDEMVSSINELTINYPNCARVYDALDRWPDLANLHVCEIVAKEVPSFI